MAARRRRKWIAIGGATAAVAIGAWGAAALATPSGVTVSPLVTRLAPHVTWAESDATVTGYTVQRSGPGCSATFGDVGTADLSRVFNDATLPADGSADGTYCYRVVSHYPDPAPDATSPASSSVLYDTKAPTPVFAAPISNGATVHGAVTVQATSTDPGGSGVATTTITINGAGFASAPAGTATGQWVTPAGVATATLVASSTDVAGNTSSTSVSVNIDNAPPAAFTIFAPSPVSGGPTLSWPDDLANTYTVTRDGAAIPGVTSVRSPWTDTSSPATGLHTYAVTATDGAGNHTSASVTVRVVSPDVTAPRSLSIKSPTNTVPHLTWQQPEAFFVTDWRIYRDGIEVATVGNAATTSFDDQGVGAQGAHTYAVRAMSDSTPGALSSAVSVIYDTTPPALAPASATVNPNGSISLTWPDATDPDPGSGVANYAVRRGTGSSAPGDAGSGTAICTLSPPANVCTDGTSKSGTNYGYAVFAVDAAGNFARRETSAKASDTQAPDPVDGLKVLTFDRTYARLTWTVPALKGADADVAGYRVIKLRPGSKTPLSPTDGTVVCRNDDPKDNICDALGLTTGKKVTFAVYALDEVPNYAPPMVVSMVPHSIDKKPPHKPTKVRLSHSGLTYTLKWVSPKDRDLSKFRVTLYDKGPAPKPSKGKVVGQGRVLHATFTLTPGKRTYVNLFSLDVTGNFSRVTRLIVAPGKIVPKSKKKKVTQPPAKKTVKKPIPAKTVKKPAQPEKPIPVTVAAKG